MSTYRLFREGMIMGCTIGGAVLGFYAGKTMVWPTSEIVLAFVGMALCGAFADICTRR